ncbi:MAG: glucosamine-6-phosphate deaminase [Clostridiales bacterium]|nr:glucosamine-6-phosphate deaminase [Clostridiales bacterium]
MMKKIVCENLEKWTEAVADEICKAVEAKPELTMILATGSTPEPVYDELVKRNKEGKVSFKGLKSYNLDEYVGLPGDDVNSYRYYMDSRLFNHIDADKANLHLPSGVAEDMEQECVDYEAALAAEGYADFAILGIGMNGHIGFNEPGTAFDSVTHIVELTQSTIDANSPNFEDPSQMPRKAITMGLKTIMESKTILLMVRGAKKAATLKAIVDGPVTEEVPGSILQNHANVIVVADAEAAALL